MQGQMRAPRAWRRSTHGPGSEYPRDGQCGRRVTNSRVVAKHLSLDEVKLGSLLLYTLCSQQLVRLLVVEAKGFSALPAAHALPVKCFSLPFKTCIINIVDTLFGKIRSKCLGPTQGPAGVVHLNKRLVCCSNLPWSSTRLASIDVVAWFTWLYALVAPCIADGFNHRVVRNDKVSRRTSGLSVVEHRLQKQMVASKYP